MSGKIVGMNKNRQGTNKTRVGKHMKWGDMSAPRPSTPEYCAGIDRIFGDDIAKRRAKQDNLFKEAQEEKKQLMAKIAAM